MAFYLVRATPVEEKLEELKEKLRQEEFKSLRPFGQTLHQSLRNARILPEGKAIWEEEDYCTPPLAQEREAVLDRYFKDIELEKVDEGEGWERINALSHLFPGESNE